jgi:hypothetical protein
LLNAKGVKRRFNEPAAIPRTGIGKQRNQRKFNKKLYETHTKRFPQKRRYKHIFKRNDTANCKYHLQRNIRVYPIFMHIPRFPHFHNADYSIHHFQNIEKNKNNLEILCSK